MFTICKRLFSAASKVRLILDTHHLQQLNDNKRSNDTFPHSMRNETEAGTKAPNISSDTIGSKLNKNLKWTFEGIILRQ